MLSRTTIATALAKLSDELGKAGVLGELNIVGGTAMLLAFNARDATKDVDAIFQPTTQIRAAASAVARDLDLPADWLNDSVKGLLSPSGEFAPVQGLDLRNLRVQAPTAEYMLAMKVLSSRTGPEGGHGDAADIAFLIRLLALKNADAVMDIVRRYYDPSRILQNAA